MSIRWVITVRTTGPLHGSWRQSAWNYGHPRGSTVDLLQQAIGRPRSAAVMLMTFDSGNGTPHAREIQQAIYANPRDGDVIVVASPEAVFSFQTSQ